MTETGASSRASQRTTDRRPVVVVTRPLPQARAMIEALEGAGVQARHVPAIRIGPPGNLEALREAVSAMNSFDWIVFTSPNAVRAMSGADPEASPSRPRVGAVGPATAAAVRRLLGREADLIPGASYSVEGLVASFAPISAGLRGAKVLLPLADLAGPELTEAFERWGAQVQRVEAYRILAPEIEEIEVLCDALDSGSVDLVTFTSPSTVHNLVAAMGDRRPALPAAVIGAATGEAARTEGLEIVVEASESTVEGLVSAVLEHLHLSHRGG